MNSRTRIFGFVGALILSGALVGGAYIFSGPLPFRTANAASTDELLKSYAAKDTDADGLPDWEEALYGTDPNNPMSFQAGVKDGDAVSQGLIKPRFMSEEASSTVPTVPGVTAAPDTLTDQFAKTLFTQYINNRGSTQPSTDDINAFVENGMQTLFASQLTPDSYTAAQVKSSGTSGADAITAYAGQMEQAFGRNTVPTTKSPTDYFTDVVTKNDAAALKKVGDMATAYANIAAAVMKVPAPQEVMGAHLEIANALMRMHEATADFATINTDPLRAMLGLSEYNKASDAMVTAFADMNIAFKSEGISIPEGASGSQFLNVAEKDSALANTP